MRSNIIVTGHYGSGKTEFAVNYALKIAEEHPNVNLIDLDIINPYFRSREKADILSTKGLKVHGSNLKNNLLDLPALSASIQPLINDSDSISVFDVGGDPEGATVLARYSQHIGMTPYDMYLVINANRPETRTPENVIKYLRGIEEKSGLQINGLINNTHMLHETCLKDILRGWKLVTKVSEMTGIPIMYTTVSNALRLKLRMENLFAMNIYMREPWMS